MEDTYGSNILPQSRRINLNDCAVRPAVINKTVVRSLIIWLTPYLKDIIKRIGVSYSFHFHRISVVPSYFDKHLEISR